MTPCNTPATPPNFPDALAAFSRLSTTGSPSNASGSTGGTAPPVSPLATHPPPPLPMQMQMNAFSGAPNPQTTNYSSLPCSTAVSISFKIYNLVTKCKLCKVNSPSSYCKRAQLNLSFKCYA